MKLKLKRENLPGQGKEKAWRAPVVSESSGFSSFCGTKSARGFRIDERKSSNASGSGSNRWLYTDVVGIENLAAGLNPEVVAAIKESSERKVRLWSLEVKILINRSNVRETYYQAVSNSSWANLGYLVAAQIDGADTLHELRNPIRNARHRIDKVG